MKKFMKHINGGIMFAVTLVLFFAVPPLYRLIDPTAGQYDAGVLHNAVIAAVYTSFATGFAWYALKLIAPGVHGAFDAFIESDEKYATISNKARLGAILYVVFFFAQVLATLFI